MCVLINQPYTAMGFLDHVLLLSGSTAPRPVFRPPMSARKRKNLLPLLERAEELFKERRKVTDFAITQHMP